jgi:tRNA (cmo5U34)-methyltransferase
MGRSWRSADVSRFIASLSAKLLPSVGSILDLGAGDGDLAPLLMDLFRGARFLGIDHDATRMGLLEGKLAFYVGRVSLVVGDLLATPYGSQHDLAVSTTAMRHVNADEKHRVYTRVHGALADGGVFLFGDRIRLASPRVLQAVRELRAEEMHALSSASKSAPPADQRTPDAPARETIADTLYALRRAAFRDVECVYCYGDRAVFAGFK